MKKLFKNQTVMWLIWCSILGSIGWVLHDFKLYQPIWAWIIGTIIFETFLIFFIIILSSFTTSIFFWNYTNVLKQLAGTGLGINFSNSEKSENFCITLIVIFHLIVNIFMAYVLSNRIY